MLDHRCRPRPRPTATDLVRVAILTLAAALVVACGGAAATPGPTGPDASVAPPSPGGDGGVPGGPKLVVPRPGQLDVHPVEAELIEARVDGRRVILTLTWTSGVEPCTILDTIVVDRQPGAFAVTLREGSGPGEPVCIAIAETHRAEVDLGELEPGTYTVTDATGGAAPIEVVVS